MEAIVNAESTCKGVACMPLPAGDKFDCLYNGTCVFLVDGHSMSEEDMNVLASSIVSKFMELNVNRDGEQRVHHMLLVELAPPKERVSALMQMVERRKQAGDMKAALALLTEVKGLLASPQYVGPGSVAWICSTGIEIEVADHPLTRDALPELAKLYAEAQALEPSKEALEAAAMVAPSERERAMKNMLTHDFDDGCILGTMGGDVTSETASRVVRQQICKHCGFRFPPCDYIPVCTRVASTSRPR